MDGIVTPPDAALIDWLNSHEKDLEPYAGRWVAIHLRDGIVSHGTIHEADRAFRKLHPTDEPFLYLVPSADEGPYVV